MGRREANGARYSHEKGREKISAPNDEYVTRNTHGIMSPPDVLSYPMHMHMMHGIYDGAPSYDADTTQDGM